MRTRGWTNAFVVIVAIGAMGYGAFALGVDPMWIGIGVAVLFGLGLMGAARKAGIGGEVLCYVY